MDVEREFKLDIPNSYLSGLRTLDDVLRFVKSPPTKKRTLFENIDDDDLPANLHIQRE